MNKDIMHKDKKVVTADIDKRGFIEKNFTIHDVSLLPCSYSESEEDIRVGLQRWMLSRMLGRTRMDIAPIKSFYGPDIFNSKNMVSLFDSYWIRNNEDETWDNVSPYREENWDPEEDCYFELLNDPENTFDVDNKSPNLTIPGVEHRFWYVYKGKIGLITENSQSDMKIYKKAKELGLLDYVAEREYIIRRGTIYSFHPTGTDENIERIPFDVLYDSVADENLKKIENLSNCCEKYGVKDWRGFFSAVMKIDKESEEGERNLCEIGVLRNSDTLEVIGFEKI